MAQLPKAYYQDCLDLSLSDKIWNFEANGLPKGGEEALKRTTARGGEYTLRMTFPESIDNAEISLDRISFKKLKINDSIAEVPVTVDHALLSFDIRLPDPADVTCPLRDVELIDSSSPQGKIENFDLYIREINLSACDLKVPFTSLKPLPRRLQRE